DAQDRLGVELGGGDEVRMQVHGALRRPGRARGVQPEAHVVAGSGGGFCLRLHCAEKIGNLGNDVLNVGSIPEDRLEVLQKRLRHEERASAAVAQLVLESAGVRSVFIATGTIPALIAPRNTATQSAESSMAIAMRSSLWMFSECSALAARSTRSASCA